jgi:hypothetical protein
VMGIGDRSPLLLAEKIENCNVVVGPGLISGGRSSISRCGSFDSVQVRSCIYAGQSMLGVLCFSSTPNSYYQLLHQWSTLSSLETGTVGQCYTIVACLLFRGLST